MSDSFLEAEARYQKEWKKFRKNYDAEEEAYNKALREQISKVESAIRNRFSEFFSALPGLVLKVKGGVLEYKGQGSKCQYQVTVQTPHTEDWCLWLYWDILYDTGDGEVKVFTESYSGLNVSTSSLVNQFNMLVKLLGQLVETNWPNLFSKVVKPVEIEDYIKSTPPLQPSLSKENSRKGVIDDPARWKAVCLNKLQRACDEKICLSDLRYKNVYLVDGPTRTGKGIRFRKVSSITFMQNKDQGMSIIAGEDVDSLNIDEFLKRMFNNRGEVYCWVPRQNTFVMR